MEYKFKIPCSKSKLGDIREFLQRVLSENSIPEVTVNSLVLAVDEVCANLIIHSHQCNPADQIELKVRVNGKTEITFDIIDHGCCSTIWVQNCEQFNQLVDSSTTFEQYDLVNDIGELHFIFSNHCNWHRDCIY